MSDLFVGYLTVLIMWSVFFIPILTYSIWSDITHVSRYTHTRRDPEPDEVRDMLEFLGALILGGVLWPLVLVGGIGYVLFRLGRWVVTVISIARS